MEEQEPLVDPLILVLSKFGPDSLTNKRKEELIGQIIGLINEPDRFEVIDKAPRQKRSRT